MKLLRRVRAEPKGLASMERWPGVVVRLGNEIWVQVSAVT